MQDRKQGNSDAAVESLRKRHSRETVSTRHNGKWQTQCRIFDEARQQRQVRESVYVALSAFANLVAEAAYLPLATHCSTWISCVSVAIRRFCGSFGVWWLGVEIFWSFNNWNVFPVVFVGLNVKSFSLSMFGCEFLWSLLVSSVFPLVFVYEECFPFGVCWLGVLFLWSLLVWMWNPLVFCSLMFGLIFGVFLL